MLSLDAAAYYAFTREDFWVFVQRVFAELNKETFSDNWHIQLLTGRLDRLRTGDARLLAIALPPRSLKSIIVSVALPAWLMGHDPAKQIICISYGQDLADKLAGDCRQVMQSEWYRRLFPAARLAHGRQSLSHFMTEAGGSRIATSLGGVLTGLGADIIIVDDPMKPDDALSDSERQRANAWLGHTMFTRLNDKKKGQVVIVMQRLHEEDTIGHAMTLADFDLLSLPAIAQGDEEHRIETPFGDWTHHRAEGEALHADREPLEVLASLQRSMGSRFFAAQYLQMPAPPGGALVRSEWFQRYVPASLPRFSRIVQSWDTASKASQLSDYSVCTTWGVQENRYYLLHVLRDRLDYPNLRRTVRDHARLHSATTILIEDTASGIALLQDLRAEGLSGLQAVKPKGDKVMRMQAQTGVMEAGRVLIPSNAHWLAPYLHELEMFPGSRHDDQVDSTSQALAHLASPTGIEGWLAYMEEKLGPSSGRAFIHVNHTNPDAQFRLSSGRFVARSSDGSFFVTPSELDMFLQVPGAYRMTDRQAA